MKFCIFDASLSRTETQTLRLGPEKLFLRFLSNQAESKLRESERERVLGGIELEERRDGLQAMPVEFPRSEH